jgi:hypothetical protein
MPKTGLNGVPVAQELKYRVSCVSFTPLFKHPQINPVSMRLKNNANY